MRSDSARDGRVAALVSLVLFAAYVAVQRGRVLSFDGTIMVHVSTRLLTLHTFTLGPLAAKLHLPTQYTSYGFGTSLLALPFDAVQRAIHVKGGSILTLANPVVLAASGSVLYLIGRRLGWRAWVCVATALAYGLVTPALWQSTEMFSEPGVTLSALAIVLGVLSWSERPRAAPLLIGLGAAFSVLFRPDSLILIVPLALAAAFLIPRRELFTRTSIVMCGSPIVLVAIFQLWYDQRRFGSVFNTGFGQQGAGLGFSTPILQGLDLLLRSPGRGFFWTAPVLLLALPGFVWLYRRNTPITIAIAGVVVARFLLFARWWTPSGGLAWGPRLLFPITALLAIPAGQCIEHIAGWHSLRGRTIAWAGIGALTTVNALLSVLSVTIPYELYWHLWTTGVAPPLRPAHIHSYFFSLRHNPIVGDIHLLGSGRTLAPIHFRGSPDAVGVLAVVISVLGAVGTFAYANRSRRSVIPDESADRSEVPRVGEQLV